MTMNCIGCGHEVKRLDAGLKPSDDPAKDMYDGGIVEWIYAGYGSRHDTTRFLICVCDDCIERYDHV